MRNIVDETLHSLQAYLQKMVNGCDDIVKHLQGGNEGNALNVIPYFVDGLQWIFDAMSGLKSNGVLEKIDLTLLKEHFEEMVDALKNGDYVLLADLLEYEVAPVLKKWKLIVNEEIYGLEVD